MRLEVAAAPAFARHESFQPRHGWLKRVVDAAVEDPAVFTREDAVVTLGVGKNMVRAMKHWGLAAKVLAPLANPERPRMPLVAPSAFGLGLLGDDGLDPYCEDPATLWVLHWRLLSPTSLVPVWWSALNEFSGVAFAPEELEDFVIERLDRSKEWDAPHPGSLRKDVACFLRMYTAMGAGVRATSDDVVDCPFRQLGLVRIDGRQFRFDLGRKPGLAPRVVLWACLDYMSRVEPEARTVTVSRLASEPGAPGKAFGLTDESLTTLLGEASGEICAMGQVAGVAQLSWTSKTDAAATSVLWSHYSGRRRPGGRPMAGPQSDAGAATGKLKVTA